jgi:hypothetical protein
VDESPIEQLLAAVDSLDVEAVMTLMAPEARFLAVVGRRAQGAEAVRELISAFLGALRSTSHKVTAQWHVDDVWIGEVDASYELQDWLKIDGLPRAFVLRMQADDIADVRVYGAHEHPLTDHRTGEEGLWIGDRWIPPL